MGQFFYTYRKTREGFKHENVHIMIWTETELKQLVKDIYTSHQTLDLIHITKDFSFLRKQKLSQYHFTIDNNCNVFNSNEPLALAQIGTDWKILN